MEQVLCNVYYSVSCTIDHKTRGSNIPHNLGYFEKKEDADIAYGIFKTAIFYTRANSFITYIHSHSIDKVYIPENEKVPYFKSAIDFYISNPYVSNYLKNCDPSLFEQIKKQVEQSKEDAKQSYTHPHDHLTDEEDNFC